VVSVKGQPDAAAVVEYGGARVQKLQKPEKEGVAAGSDRALYPLPPGPGLEAAELLLADGELLAAAAPLLDVALTIP
jgi:hypothetical protein